MYLSQVHQSKLQNNYGLNSLVIEQIAKYSLLSSASSEQVRQLLGRSDIESGGIVIRHPNHPDLFTVRLDDPPLKDGRQMKYLRPAGQPNGLFIPLGVSLDVSEIWLTEGELKAACAASRGLAVVGLSGVWNWRTKPEESELFGEEKIPDIDAVIQELARDWSRQQIALIYDSDINTKHCAYPAFTRRAEQLYRMGADKVKIITLPSLISNGKTGLDDFFLVREKAGKDAVAELKALVSRGVAYLPIGDGAEFYAEKVIKKNPDDTDSLTKAATAILAAKGEVFFQGWLKQNVKGTSELRKAITKEAKGAVLKRAAPVSVKHPGNSILNKEIYQQIFPRIPSPYTLDGRGFLCYVKHHENQAGEWDEVIPLANVCPYPTRQIVRDDGIDFEVVFELSGILSGGMPLPRVIVPAKDFSNMNWIVPAWGMKANPEPGQGIKERIRHHIQAMALDLPHEVVYTHLGWRKIEGKWTFLHSAGAVGAEGVQTETDSRLSRYRLPETTEDIKFAVEASLELLKIGPARVTLPLLSLTYLAPLTEVFRKVGLEPAFICFLFGTTGSLKSSVSALFLNHYGSDFSGKSLPGSFRDTANSLEKRSFQAKDVLFDIDDFYPSADQKEGRKIEQTAQQLIRAYGDRVGRGRMASDTSLRKDYPPRGMLLASGEELPQGQSSGARLFVIEMGRGDVNMDKLSRAQESREKLAHSMRGFLEWLSPQMDELPGKLRERFKKLREKAKTEGQHLRLPETISWLFIGFETFLDFAATAGTIDDETKNELAEEGWEVLNSMALEQSQRVQAERPAQKFIDLLKELLVQKRIYLKNLDGLEPTAPEKFGWIKTLDLNGEENYQPGKIAEQLGWTDGKYMYLLPDSTYKEISTFCRNQGSVFPVKQQTLLKHLEAEQLLVTEQDRSRTYRTVRKTCEGQVRRVMQLHARDFQT